MGHILLVMMDSKSESARSSAKEALNLSAVLVRVTLNSMNSMQNYKN